MKAWMQQYLILLLLSLPFTTAFACTDIRVTAKDGSVIIGRTLEFAPNLQSNLVTSNRNRTFKMTAPDGSAGLSWVGKNGYVFLNAFNQDIAVDGMNEKGLSYEGLYLPGLAVYQTVPKGSEKQALPYYNLGDWILSNFDNIEQVKAALPKVWVYAGKLPQMGETIFPIHAAVYDAQGKGIVIEYIAGQLHIYDNAIGVMTNSPGYAWHLTNLNNYVHLRPSNPSPVVDNGITFAATGQGFGMIGLPGDISPPSRFVKMATLLNVIVPPQNATDGLNMAEHLLNNVDIPLGLAREDDGNKVTNELTQWTVYKDLTHRIFYYKTYSNLTVRGIMLDKINFAANAPRLKLPINTPPMIQDMTNQLNASVIKP